MPDGISFDISGIPEVKAMLDNLSTKEADRIMRTALKAGADIVKEAIEVHAPERPDLPSGTALPIGALKADIKSKVKKVSDDVYVATIEPDEATFHVALFVEEGHRLVRGGYSKEVIKAGENTGKYRGPGQEVGQVEARPFVRPAWEACREEATTAIATTLATEIEKASK